MKLLKPPVSSGTQAKAGAQQGAKMGLTYVDLTLTNNGLFGNGKTETIRALVDTGSDRVVIPPALAERLGYDIAEARTVNVTLADGRKGKVPIIEPIQIRYLDHIGTFQAAVMNCDECLLGVLALQSMMLKVNPMTHTLEYDPRCERV